MILKYLLLCVGLFLMSCHQDVESGNSTNNLTQSTTATSNPQVNNPHDYAIIIHGGAGYMTPENLKGERKSDYEKKLKEVIEHGSLMLQRGEEAVDVVTEVIKLMENSPLFNAGKGSVYTHDKKNEMDASIMTGHDQMAGAVAGVTIIKNPIEAARKVMEETDHVLLVREGAERFAKLQQCEIVDPNYFYSERSMQAIDNALDNEKKRDSKFGTVGCVVLDKKGHLAAGTSTGGMTNKKFNRVGDSPIVGAGTYANDEVGVSCTGHGEYFIRYSVAYDLFARMKYENKNIKIAANELILKDLKDKGGNGGLIALDRNGQFAMPFNTSGMFRAYANPDTSFVAIFN